ncbi:hypothetical protein DSL92_07160 [Billgrantia gudaonensis]|uniref:Arylamine N-acetyltransferase n=1 Tax=Billgrantia gudaonensis TaxID=376427 RepID=A0A432JH64_9GAMM|nr:hypothetical protein DSL92_07160 [Halomonas gudaonensis]
MQASGTLLHESATWEASPRPRGLSGTARLPRVADPSLETLRALQRAHLEAIPSRTWRSPSAGDPDLASLQDKLVRRRRGGYCHEQNLLFGTVLDRLGFRVVPRARGCWWAKRPAGSRP